MELHFIVWGLQKCFRGVVIEHKGDRCHASFFDEQYKGMFIYRLVCTRALLLSIHLAQQLRNATLVGEAHLHDYSLSYYTQIQYSNFVHLRFRLKYHVFVINSCHLH